VESNSHFFIEENYLLAEMVGIILGDGHLSSDGYYLTINLNFQDEFEYVLYILKLFESLFKIHPIVVKLPNNKANHIRISNRYIVEFLTSKGLKLGNKVKNQVGVPEWIKKDEIYHKYCLRGLFDTDGSIFPVIKENSLKINFKNNSKPLVRDFKFMCEVLGIEMANIIEGWTHSRGKRFRYFKVHIGGKEQVAKFLYIVKPMKWEYKKYKFDRIFKNNGSCLIEALDYKHKEWKKTDYVDKLIKDIKL
jgi:flagellar protein FlaI